MSYYCWKCHVQHEWFAPCPIEKAEEIAATTNATLRQMSDQQRSLENLTRNQSSIISTQKEEIELLRKIAAPIIEEEQRKLREKEENARILAEALAKAKRIREEKEAEEERQRQQELISAHKSWIAGLDNESAKSVFIFNDVKIAIHNHRDDPNDAEPIRLGCQAGRVSYENRFTTAGKLSVSTENNVTTFSDGKVFVRSGDQVYGSDGSYFRDPVPPHLNIKRDLKVETEYFEKYTRVKAELIEQVLQEKREAAQKRNRKLIFAGAFTAVAATAAAVAISNFQYITDYIAFNDKGLSAFPVSKAMIIAYDGKKPVIYELGKPCLDNKNCFPTNKLQVSWSGNNPTIHSTILFSTYCTADSRVKLNDKTANQAFTHTFAYVSTGDLGKDGNYYATKVAIEDQCEKIKSDGVGMCVSPPRISCMSIMGQY